MEWQESDTPERLKHGSSHRKEWSAAVCSGMDAPGDRTPSGAGQTKTQAETTTHIKGPESDASGSVQKTGPAIKNKLRVTEEEEKWGRIN